MYKKIRHYVVNELVLAAARLVNTLPHNYCLVALLEVKMQCDSSTGNSDVGPNTKLFYEPGCFIAFGGFK